MGLGVFELINMTEFMRSGVYDFATTGESTWIQEDDVPAQGTFLYINKLGLLQIRYIHSGSNAGYVRFDPNLIDNTSSALLRYNTQSSLSVSKFTLGAYVPSTNDQKMYGRDNSSDEWDEVSITNPQIVVDADPYPMIHWNNPSPASGIGMLDDGYWNAASSRGTQIFFEGWDRLDNGNALGTMMAFGLDTIRWGGVSVATPNIFVDLSTGAGEPIEEMPSRYTASPANIYQGPPFLGETATLIMKHAQFVPDDDSVPAAPKGRILLTDTHNVSDDRRHYMRWFDFNPEGVTSFPERVHWRIILDTRFLSERTTDYSTFPGADSNIRPGSTVPAAWLSFNPATGRFFFMGSRQQGTTAQYDSTDVFHTYMLQTTNTAVVDAVTPPQPNQSVTTNRTVVMRSTVIGDIGETIPGEDVDWTLERLATRDELLVITEPRTPGDAADAVANIPIDDSPTYPWEVRKNGVPLVETTNYTVNRTSGVITFVTPEPIDGFNYTVDYGHPTVPASPAIGSLLTAADRSDAFGEVTTRIKYSDEPLDEGFIDQCTVTTST